MKIKARGRGILQKFSRVYQKLSTPESRIIVLTSGTLMRPSMDSQGTNTKTYGL